jgi:hypothetical protein
VRAAIPDPGRRTSAFAAIDLAVNALTIATQVFAAGPLLTRVGLPRTLSFLPALSLAGFAALAVLRSVAQQGRHAAVKLRGDVHHERGFDVGVHACIQNFERPVRWHCGPSVKNSIGPFSRTLSSSKKWTSASAKCSRE